VAAAIKHGESDAGTCEVLYELKMIVDIAARNGVR
jgi:hypothetical protein